MSTKFVDSTFLVATSFLASLTNQSLFLQHQSLPACQVLDMISAAEQNCLTWETKYFQACTCSTLQDTWLCCTCTYGQMCCTFSWNSMSIWNQEFISFIQLNIHLVYKQHWCLFWEDIAHRTYLDDTFLHSVLIKHVDTLTVCKLKGSTATPGKVKEVFTE